MYINSNIKYLRKKQRKSRSQLSKEIKIGTRTLESYEMNRSSPPLRRLVNIADYFKVTIDDLIRKDLSLD